MLPRSGLAFFRELAELRRLSGVGEIARRYMAMNAFDGVLTMVGVLMGNYAADIADPDVVIRTGVATSIAMGVSGLWGAYLTETAERERELDDLERATLQDLRQTKIGRASRLAAVVVSVVDGLSPFVAALVVLLPFFFAPWLPAIDWAYGTSIGMALLGLFGLGLFLGHVSGRNLLLYGLRTVVAGLICIALTFLLEGKS